ncbi:MAG TPA: FAD-binding oxidoreductase [Chloroflexia bacterium]|nr:FAD-binding oxidoreductase [Chloroflexia bacterium]
MTDFESALHAWRMVLGVSNVINAEAGLQEIERATFSTEQHVLAVIRPADTREVQECLRIAAKYGVPLYPVSTGKNWGYGSRVPVETDSVVLDLGRLNRIVDFDEELAYVTVEPGVTFQQLYEYLQARGSNLMMSVTGSTPYSSVLANVLERGLGHGSYGNRVEYACHFEVVLPGGELINTGFGRYRDARTKNVSRWGLGPALDGLFSQSNLGIVTRMTVWLRPAPKYMQVCKFLLGDDTGLPDLMQALQKLKLEELVNSPISLFNDYKLLAMQQRFPGEEVGENYSLLPGVLDKIKQSKSIARWNGMLTLYASSKKHGLVLQELVVEAMQGLVEVMLFQDETTSWIYEGRTGRLVIEKPSASRGFKKSPLYGVPFEEDLATLYWRKQESVKPEQGPDFNPDKDGCGLIWCHEQVPFTGKDVAEAVRIIDETIRGWNFEPVTSLRCMSGRSVNVLAAIIFDRAVAGEDRQARKCHTELVQKLVEAGYFPSRLDITTMKQLSAGDKNYVKLIKTLKTALDPQMTLAPGRYDFQQDWPE